MRGSQRPWRPNARPCGARARSLYNPAAGPERSENPCLRCLSNAKSSCGSGSAEEARAAILAAGATPLLGPPAAGGRAARHARRAAAAASVRAARPLRVRQEPADVQGAGAAGRHESPRGARDRGRRRRGPAAGSARSSACTSGSATRSTARSSRTRTSSWRSTRRRSACSSRSKAANAGIAAMARALGRTPADYIARLVPRLFLQHRDELGLTGADMVFDADGWRRPSASRAARARADGGPRHAAAAADLCPRQAGGAGQRRTARRAASCSGSRATASADVVLNLHHLPETIAAVVGDGADLGVRVRYSWEQPVLGSAGGPRHALPLLTDGGDDAVPDRQRRHADRRRRRSAMRASHARVGRAGDDGADPQPAAGEVRRRRRCPTTGASPDSRGAGAPGESYPLHRRAGRGRPQRSRRWTTACPPNRSTRSIRADRAGSAQRRGVRLPRRRSRTSARPATIWTRRSRWPRAKGDRLADGARQSVRRVGRDSSARRCGMMLSSAPVPA